MMAGTNNSPTLSSQPPIPTQQLSIGSKNGPNIKDILEQADNQAKALEQRTQTSVTGGKRIDLCQNDADFKQWLAQWSITPDVASQQIDSVSQLREQLDLRRSKGIHRVAASTQRLLSEMGELSTSYSGLVEVVGGVAGPYGQAANAGFRALSCLFLAATNKTGNETLVTDRLEEINRFFPRIEKMRAIYKDDTRIGVLVALIHLDIVHFADNAAQLFSNRWRRALSMLIPPSFKTDSVYESMKTRLVELRSWANIRLHENAVKTHEEVVGARGQLHEVQLQQRAAWDDLTKTQLQIAHATEELEKISKIVQRQDEEIEKQLVKNLREYLQVDDSGINFDVNLCSEMSSKLLKKTLPLYRGHNSNTAFMSRDRLEQDESFVKWSMGTQKLLLIGGATNRDLIGSSWITPAVLELAVEWSGEIDRIFVFFSGRPGGYQHGSNRMSFVNMLLGIILQVAQQVPSILREDTIRNAAKTLSKDCQEKWLLADSESLAEAVGRFLSVASAGHQIRLIIDRLDQVEEAKDRCGDIFNCLNHLVAQVSGLKILAAWSVTDDRKLIEDKLDPLFEHVIYNLGFNSGYY